MYREGEQEGAPQRVVRAGPEVSQCTHCWTRTCNPEDWIAGPGPAMSTLAYFRARPDYALGRAFLLTFAVHAVLLAFMFMGVRMQNRPGDTVTVELWETPPPPPPPVVEAPKPPPPKVEAPKPEPEPEVKKPEIVEKAPPPKPKKPEPKKAEAKAPPKDDLEKLLLREQVAMEQEKLNEDRRRADEARRKADSEKTARQLAATARDKALAEYVNRIRA